jgi:membrane-bound metal-dependent hydrolase YbcI (DUF457 family)
MMNIILKILVAIFLVAILVAVSLYLIIEYGISPPVAYIAVIVSYFAGVFSDILNDDN